MKLVKLRLSGFKSFAEPTEVALDGRLTGVVGPNGCGKSNVIEGLRWAMGESSARQLRGGEMDDVIFTGGARRPARNIAEVGILLDNKDRSAPPAFNDSDDIEIKRKIERGKGSGYRINGKPARAGDVQLLFADHNTGARSPSIVSQGRVGALIAAKPGERRPILEEAAGIAGLQARRHDAELKLNGTEDNLARLDDVLAGHEGQLTSLKRQAGQAARYRALSAQIRAGELRLVQLKWDRLCAARVAAESSFAAQDQAYGAAMLRAREATRALVAARGALQPLRAAEAEASALRAEARQALERARAQAKERTEAEKRLVEDQVRVKADLGRVRERLGRAETALAEVETEQAALPALVAADADDTHEQALLAQLLTAATATAAADEAVSAAASALAAAKANHEALTGNLRRAHEQRDLAARRLERITAERTRQQAELERAMQDDPGAALPGLEQELAAARTALIDAEAAAETREQARRSAQAALEEQRAQQAALASEHKGLLRLLAAAEPTFGTAPPVIDQFSVAAGWEVAVARALGADAKLPLGDGGDASGENHWVLPPERSQLPTRPQGPPGAAALSSHVKAPPALARRLAHTFVVTDTALAATAPDELASGVSLVTRSGAVLRWDGVRLGADENDSTAQVLAYSRRRAELEQQLRTAQSETDAAKARFDAADGQLTAIRTVMRDARAAISAREQQWRTTTKAATAHADKVNGLRGRLAATEAEHRGLVEGDQASGAGLAELDQALAALPALTPLEQTLARASQHRLGARAHEDDHRRALELHRDTRAGLAKRHQALADARARWSGERDEAGRDVQRLDTRAAELTQQTDSVRAALAAAPDLTSLQTAASHADQHSDQTRTSLSGAEQQVRTADGQQRSCENAMAEAKAARAAAEAHHGAALAALKEFSHDIEHRFGMQPEQLGGALKHADTELPPEAEPFPDDPAQLEPLLQRLLGRREALGAINLQAEAALAELESQWAELHKERDDVSKAVAVLRRGIADLNREASERIDHAFKKINGHFEALFTRLFGGGVARLTLTQPEDPLSAGLDIFAQPPGKKLQHLSLLSGGEQTLTAMALIFAVFLTNPGPICILDEVDAPLDDANVERLCDLLSDIEAQTGTRFLIITHHRLTMARMDRLFGVTMTEPGVSRLVSVDLAAAVQNANESTVS